MARALPSGLVTFAFTDVVGSTRAFTEHGEAYVAALPAVHAAIADCAAAHGGVVVKTEGDGAFLAFPSAVGAVRALLDIQESLEQQPADGLWLRIRAGAHTADAEPVDDDYLALGVHVAARVASAAGAGQVLVTPAVIAELDEEDRASTVDVGSFELKDIQEPMRLWRIAGDDAPPRATPTRRTNVAEPFTRFVGREVEIDELDRLLQDPGLVSVVGAGGMGKTRLLSEYALRRAPDLDAGIWLVELASVTSPDQVAAAVAHALGVSGVPTSATLAVELRRRGEPLLVLDNCEHVADAAAELIGELFAELPRLRVLATSREPLDVEGERVQRLGSLTTPTSLFADRAEAAGGQLTAEDADVVTEICDLLDGLPLAVELAAARTATLPPRELLEALRQGQIELRRRGGPERQRSLESLVGWSLDLLDGPHRDALRVLSVVPDRFTAEMARSLLSAVPGLPALATAELARRSLLDLDGAEYRMLVTIRDVARAELAGRPELHDAAMRALFDWAVARADPESPEPVKAWEARAMEAALECGDRPRARRLRRGDARGGPLVPHLHPAPCRLGHRPQGARAADAGHQGPDPPPDGFDPVARRARLPGHDVCGRRPPACRGGPRDRRPGHPGVRGVGGLRRPGAGRRPGRGDLPAARGPGAGPLDARTREMPGGSRDTPPSARRAGRGRAALSGRPSRSLLATTSTGSC